MAKDYVSRSKPAKRSAKKTKAAPKAKRFPLGLALVVVAAVSGFAFLLYNIQGSAPEPAPLPSMSAERPVKPADNPALPEPPEERRYVKELEEKSVEVEVAEQSSEPSRPYQMQCASFRSRDRAEESKALIAFAGLESDIKHTGGSNGSWYRVVLGPYPSKRDAERDRHVLQRANINGCQIWHWNWD
ncbi:SPOR domain-containing protein [Aliagarivorans marinus]|uniref:SPOR domain-containing protein n=1 Tax=Aliagarivorans marinus TaxID=561965 RepID=UPI0003F75CC7|nr:SPOR domain-containing protein [Aliagarivorans marinus]